MSCAHSPVMFLDSLKPIDTYMRHETNQHWFRQWLVALRATSHCLNQRWGIVNWTRRNVFQWNFNRNSNIFIQGNAFENVVWKWRSFCLGLKVLTHCDLVMPYAVWHLGQLIAGIGWAPNTCQVIVLTNTGIFSIQGNTFKNTIYKMVVILFRGHLC